MPKSEQKNLREKEGAPSPACINAQQVRSVFASPSASRAPLMKGLVWGNFKSSSDVWVRACGLLSCEIQSHSEQFRNYAS